MDNYKKVYSYIIYCGDHTPIKEVFRMISSGISLNNIKNLSHFKYENTLQTEGSLYFENKKRIIYFNLIGITDKLNTELRKLNINNVLDFFALPKREFKIITSGGNNDPRDNDISN